MGSLLNRFSEVTKNDFDSDEKQYSKSSWVYIFVFLIPIFIFSSSWCLKILTKTNSVGVLSWFFYIFLTFLYFIVSILASKTFLNIADKILKIKGRLDLLNFWLYVFFYLLPFCLLAIPWFTIAPLRSILIGQIAFYTYIFLSIIHILICLNASFRRIKDAGFSSLLFLPGLIPVIGQLYLIVLCCYPSKEIQMLPSNEEESETDI